MKKTSSVIAALSFCILAQAQSLQDAITKTDNERFESAAADFRALIAKDPNKGDYYFYYGENFYKSDNPDSALLIYKKGTEVQPTNGLNYVGLGKVQLMQGNDKEGNSNLFKAKTLGAKNATVYMKIAEAYIDAPNPYKNLSEATKLLTDAMKWAPKDPEPHLLMGDCLLEQNPTEGGPAIKEYDEALKLNPKSPKGILRKGKLYFRARNYNLALDYYKQAEAIDPNYAPAYMEKATLYQLANQPGKALESIKKYLELNAGSLIARKKYAGYLLLNKMYPEAIAEIESLLKKLPNDPYLLRYLGYAYDEMGDKTDKDANTKGLEAINKFFGLTQDKGFKYIVEDYKHKGSLLFKTGQDSLGTIEYLKAIAQDSVKNCELYGELGERSVKAKKWDNAVVFYEKRERCDKPMNGQEYFNMGRAYFYSGAPKMNEAKAIKDVKARTAKEDEARPYFVKADSAFARLTRLSPTFPTGWYWRGSANLNQEKKDQVLAKPYFEKYLEVLKSEERTQASQKNNVVIACEYLGYNSVKAKDYAKAKEYYKILQEVDPNNEKAKAFLNSPEGK